MPDRQKEYRELFDKYIRTFEGLGCDREIISLMRNLKKEKVVQTASSLEIPAGHVPFVGPIISPGFLGYYGLMSMVRIGEKRGCISSHYINRVDIIEDQVGGLDSTALYFLYDVDVGSNMVDLTPKEKEAIIKNQSRLPITAAEAMNYCALNSKILFKHPIEAIGSRFGGHEKIPYIFLRFNNQPEFYWHYYNGFLDCWGKPAAPSCKFRR